MITWRYLLLNNFLYISQENIYGTNKVYVHASKSLGLFTSGKREYLHCQSWFDVMCICVLRAHCSFNQDKISCAFHFIGCFLSAFTIGKFSNNQNDKKNARFNCVHSVGIIEVVFTPSDNTQSIISQWKQILTVIDSALMYTVTEWPKINSSKRKKMSEVWIYVYETINKWFRIFCVFVFASSSLLILFQIN